jgi:hypothetical protein
MRTLRPKGEGAADRRIIIAKSSKIFGLPLQRQKNYGRDAARRAAPPFVLSIEQIVRKSGAIFPDYATSR